jgi:glutathione synthase/RimK-type ligase-like ATP-grasp enzyme
MTTKRLPTAYDPCPSQNGLGRPAPGQMRLKAVAPIPQVPPASARAAPSILLVATERWPIAARLAIAFRDLGCHVEVLCPGEHPAASTRAVHRLRRYAVLAPLACLRKAIVAAAPDFVIPCDDVAAVNLHRVYGRAYGAGEPRDGLRALIARSLGSPAACTLATARGRLAEEARQAGIRIPACAVIESVAQLDAFVGRHALPVVLKIDSSCGGQGVAVVHTLEQARSAYRSMAVRPPLPKAVVRSLLERTPAIAIAALKRGRRTITAQQYIAGTPANRAVACWEGKVLAGISVEAIRTQHSTGPATVVHVIENAVMNEGVQRLVQRLGVSGFWGADFIIETASGTPYLIEANPRATPTCHLALGAGKNLPAALLARLTGSREPAAAERIADDVIVMFPGEWQRDPVSPFLRTNHVDVPWNEPELVRDGFLKPWAERGWLARTWACLRPHRRAWAAASP